jgi:cell volume regulation protein A
LAGVEKANMIFNIVFFISLTSVLIQGTTLSAIAKLLHVSLPEKVKPRTPLDIELTDGHKSEMFEIELEEDSGAVGKRIVNLGFPNRALIVMINRNGQYVTPNGSTILQPEDKLVILAENKNSIPLIYECLGIKETS